jgi:hypothetical protein
MSVFHISLFILYLALLTYLVMRIPFFRKSGIHPRYLLMFFWIRIIAGVIHNLAARAFYPNKGDIWEFFEDGKLMKADLIASPSAFFSRYFDPRADWFWGYLQYSLIETLNMLLDFLSFNNMYINTLIFSFFVYAGSIALFRTFMEEFRSCIVAALPALLIPSTVYWTACIHKDGIIYGVLGFLLYRLHQLFRKGFNTGRFAQIIILLLVMGLLRAYLLLSFCIPLLAWIMAEKSRIQKKKLFWIIGGFCFAGLLVSSALPGRANILNILVESHAAFDRANGGSRLYFPELRAGLSSFLAAFPYALLNGFLQPLPGAGGQLVYIIFSLELLLLWGMVLISCARMIRERNEAMLSLSVFCILFAIINLIIMGYTVPFAGALIRYRSIFLPMLAAPFLYGLRQTNMIKSINGWLGNKLIVRY